MATVSVGCTVSVACAWTWTLPALTLASSISAWIVLVTLFVDDEIPTDAPIVPSEMAAEPTVALIVPDSVAVTCTAPVASIVLGEEVGPMISARTWSSMVLVELAPLPESVMPTGVSRRRTRPRRRRRWPSA